MPDKHPPLSSSDRETLLHTARSRHTTQGVAARARLIIDCADVGVAEAARRSSVSQATAAKWWRRYCDAGIDGLHDVAPTGRPPAPDDVVRRVLSCALDEPPGGRQRWSTRAVADVTNVSQATVSRIRRRYFTRAEPESTFFQDHSTSILSYIDAHPSGCALGFQTAGEPTPHRGASASQIDIAETIVCAALLPPPTRGEAESIGTGCDATAILRRAAERLPPTATVTLVINTEIDSAARQWLACHPEIIAHAATGAAWFGLLHWMADAIDPRQLAELREVQQRIRHARRDCVDHFVWTRVAAAQSSATRTASDAESAPPAGNLSYVIRGICTAVADCELQPGDAISPRHLARRTSISSGRVVDALEQLADEGLVDKQADRYLLPVPTPRDVIETYTARGLLGTAISRKLASAHSELPPVIDEYFAGLIRCDELNRVYEASDLDFDLQDELAAMAAMPRIGSMFIRLTLQLRLFITIFGLSFRYPTDEIVADDRRILDAIRRQDPEAAVAAWRSKTDNCARFMLGHLRAIR